MATSPSGAGSQHQMNEQDRWSPQIRSVYALLVFWNGFIGTLHGCCSLFVAPHQEKGRSKPERITGFVMDGFATPTAVAFRGSHSLTSALWMPPCRGTSTVEVKSYAGGGASTGSPLPL